MCVAIVLNNKIMSPSNWFPSTVVLNSYAARMDPVGTLGDVLGYWMREKEHAWGTGPFKG